MTTQPDTTPRALRIDGPLSARAVLDHFNDKGRALLGAGQDDAAGRIAQLLAHEADLSAAWGGLPGTDHPRHWQPEVGDEAALSDRRSEHRRLDVHLPLWWALPLAVRDRQPQRVILPLAATREALAALIRRHMPGAWWNHTVHVTLDVETRVYWGARGAVHPHAAARHACAQRGDAGHPSLRLMTLDGGRAVEAAMPDRPADPDVVLKVHPGVGWLVVVPQLRFERELTTAERWQQAAAQWWRRLQSQLGRASQRDRDPTWESRLKADEAWWAGQLGTDDASDPALARDARLGASLRPASRMATLPAAQRRQAQVIVIHGGLSSARSAYEGALNTKARAVARAIEAGEVDAPGAIDVRVDFGGASTPSIERDAAMAATAAAYDASALSSAAPPPADAAHVWPGLPMLDERATWRFEHDTFLRIAQNVAHLVAAVRRQCIAGAPAGAQRHIVLVAHSRGGNVARFALPALRKAFGKQGWTFAAVTLGSPHLGTQVFERVGQRWHGLAAAVGGLRHLGAPWMSRETLAELVNLERGLAYDVPPGFHDVEPAGVDRMMKGKPATELPAGMWLVGSHWGPSAGIDVDKKTWDWLFEDMMGAEEESDGLVRRLSALGGRMAENELLRASPDRCPVQFDASPVFHTHYLVHEDTRRQIARMLGSALAMVSGNNGASSVAHKETA